MNKFQPLFFMIALLAATMMIGIGISIAQRNVQAIISFTIALFVVMGIGFTLKRKKKMR